MSPTPNTPRTALFAATLAALALRCGDRDVAGRFYAPPVPADASAHPVTLRAPPSLRGLQGPQRGPNGAPLDVACATCHRGRSFPLPTAAAALHGPHAGMTFAHGENSCASCHDPSDAERLRLADGRSVPMTEAIALCGQCHGTQLRDYRHGAHGGMNGYWDLRRGPRERNHCVHCHDPHAPAYPRFVPLPAPPDAPRAHGHSAAPHANASTSAGPSAPHGSSHE